MKRQLKRLKGKRLVTGDTNLMTKNEICINTTSNGGVEVKEIGTDGKIKDLAGSGGASKNPFTEYLYFKFDSLEDINSNPDVADSVNLIFNMSVYNLNSSRGPAVKDYQVLHESGSVDILHMVYKGKHDDGSAIYLNDPSNFYEVYNGIPFRENGFSFGIRRYINAVLPSGSGVGVSSNGFIDFFEFMATISDINLKELFKYQTTEEEFWKEATITNISIE